MSILCSMVGASFVTAAAEVIRAKKGITAVGNAQVDTAQSKFGGASLLLDGTGDYLTTDSASLAVGTGDFTFECWARASDTNAFMLFDQTTPTGSSNGYSIWLQVSTLNVYSGGWVLQTVGTITTNTWHHIAVTRSGSSLRAFIDGTQVGSTITTSNNISQTLLFMGAARIDTSTYDGNGYMDEIRISNNARYTTTFTPSTTPFVNDANTLLLIHADGTDASTFFEDDNGVRGPKAIRRLDNGSISTSQSKFGGTSLDLTGGTNAPALRGAYSSDLSVGTGDFTIETWVRFTGTENQGYNQIYGQWQNPYVTLFYIQGTIGSGTAQSMVLVLNNAVTSNTASTTGLFTTGVWYHIAVTRSSGTILFFKDGTQVTTTAGSTNTQNLTGVSDFGIGYNIGADQQKLVGYLDELRVSNSARYTANFTAPTAPFVNDANTLLLLHMDGTNASTNFRDDVGIGRSPRGIQAVGNAQVDTAQSKFGGAAALFDGTGDYLQIGAYTDLNLGTNDFTYEFWYRQTTSNTYATFLSSGTATYASGAVVLLGGSGTGSTTAVRLAAQAAGGTIVYDQSGSAPSNSVWYHFALTRSGNTFTLYRDGTSVGTGTYSGSINWNDNSKTVIGGGNWDGASSYVTGWMDEIRLSNSVRYTTTFTPSTTPFQNDANTLLLIHADGTDASTVFTDDNGTRPV